MHQGPVQQLVQGSAGKQVLLRTWFSGKACRDSLWQVWKNSTSEVDAVPQVDQLAS